MVIFDVWFLNIVGGSDEIFFLFLGIDGVVVLVMCYVIFKELFYDESFLVNWMNVFIDELYEYFVDFILEWVEKVSGVLVRDIVRIVCEFVVVVFVCMMMCNWGSLVYLNGYYNDWVIYLLNVFVGSVGWKGGWCWFFWGGFDFDFKMLVMFLVVKIWSLFEDLFEYLFVNVWWWMCVGEVIYFYFF